MKKSESSSDSSVPPSPTGIRKSRKKKEKTQALDKLRKMVGCDKSTSNLELLQVRLVSGLYSCRVPIVLFSANYGSHKKSSSCSR